MARPLPVRKRVGGIQPIGGGNEKNEGFFQIMGYPVSKGA